MPTADPAPFRNSHDSRIRAELARVLFQHSAVPVALNFLIVAASVAALWPFVPGMALLAWAAAIYVVAIARLVLSARLVRATLTPEAVLRWAWIYTLFAGATGCLWGALGLGFADPAQQPTLVFTGVVLAGLVGGSVASLSTFPPAFVAYTLPTMAPFFWLAATQRDFIFIAGALVLVVNFLYARIVYRKAREATELRFLNEDLATQLAEEKRRVEAASRAKSVFLASASHDLRQPVHAMSLYLERLRGEALTPAQRETVERIGRSVEAMDELFDALLDVSRLDAGAVQPAPVDFPATRLLDRIRADCAPLAAAKGLRLEVAGSDAVLRSDPLLLERIVKNFVINALRHSAAGTVSVGCTAAGGAHRIAVRDTGPGIPADKHREVFLEFVQLENPERDRRKGLGLGLAIVERLARLMGHPVALDSAPGRGSEFSVTVPAGDPERVRETVATAVEPADDFEGALVAVVDDEQEVREAMQSLLESWRCEVVAAGSVAEVMQLLARSTRAPDALICDYRLRGAENGIAMIEAAREEFNTEIPALIVTGDTAPLAAAAGMGRVSILHKPLQPARLRAALRNLLRPAA